MAMTKEERMAIIKQAHQNFLAKQEAKAGFKARAKKSTKKAMTEILTGRKARDQKFDQMMDKMDENHNHWTDASKYASEYYGGVAFETTRFDNDWN